MRIRHLFAVLALAACATAPGSASAQSVGISINLGVPQTVLVYDEVHDGPWRTAYLEWEPVPLYVYEGVYYERPVRGARVVMVYRHGREYILPPRDRAWVGMDRRFDYKRAPQDWDYDHGKRHDEDHDRDHDRGRGRGRGGHWHDR
jgi:hypothetical protein